MINLDWTVLATGAVFLFTLWMLNTILFKPLMGVLDKRRGRTSDLQRIAAEKLEYHEALFQQYAEKIKQAKQQGYQLAESMRKDAMGERQKRISEARSEADLIRGKARSRIEQEVVAVRERLRQEAEEIAGVIAARVLGKN